MIIFLYGQDDYRLKQKLQEIKKRAKELVFVNSFEEFTKANQTNSLLAVRKVIIINNLSEEFSEIEDSDNIIVFYAQNPDKRTKLFKKLLKIAQCEEFRPLSGYKLSKWIQDASNCNLAVADKLSVYLGNDLWRLSNEISKLKAYADNQPISDKDLDLLIKAEIKPNIFKTIDALAVGNKKIALKLLSEHLAIGDDENYLFNMFCYQFKNILKVKIGDYSGFHPFVLSKTKSMARKYSLKQLQTIYSQLLTLDFQSKTGKVSQPATFFLLLYFF